MSGNDELQRLREELAALRLANEALERQMLAEAEQVDAMLREVEAQRNALRDAHQRQRDLGEFTRRVMDTVASLVIVLGVDGRVNLANTHCRAALARDGAALDGSVLDDLLPAEERTALTQALPALPWPVHSALFETVRRHGRYSAEHRFAGRDGAFRHYLVEAAMLHNRQGKEEGAVVNATDITQLKRQEQQLRASEARLNEAQRVAQLGSWELDLTSQELIWSDEVFRIFEIDPVRFGASYNAFLDTIHPDDRAMVDRAYTNSLLTRQSYDIEHRLLFADGRIKWVNEHCATYYDDSGAPLRSVGTVQDITARRRAEDEMRLAASVFDNSLNGILITSPDGRIIKVNRAFTDITGYTAPEAIGKTPRILKSDHHDDAFYRTLWATLLEKGKWEGEIWDRCKDGRMVPIWQSMSAVRDGKGDVAHYIGIFYDISEQKASAERIHRLAHYDALTGLPNRVLLLDRCELALARMRRDRGQLALLFLDLDRFKHVNDSLGHPVGDDLLRAVADRLRRVLRERDTVARLGGDEFIVLLEGIESAVFAEEVAQRLIEAIAEPFAVRSHTLSVGTTIGISLYPSHGEDVTTLIKHADLALYQAKEAGRGCYRFFEARLTTQASERMRLESDLRQALPRGQFLLHFQPQYALDDGRLVGAEALLRWRHPERGLVQPDAFIPIAEDTGLIVPIGAWVLAEACRQAKEWLDAGISLERMAVNLSGIQIQRGDIVATVAQVLRDSGLPARCLELEITETYIMRQGRHDLAQLQALRELGVTLAIDDFGTGQSSLGYLKHLPIERLKIDRSFIADVVGDRNSAAIARAILSLGQGLRMVIVAEGVETAEQELFLKHVGCDEVQGFHYSRPVDAAAFARLLVPKNKPARAARHT